MRLEVAQLAPAPRTGVAAVAWCRGQHLDPSRDWTRDCQMFCRSAFGLDAYFGRAIDAWQGAPPALRHPGELGPYGSVGYFAGPPGAAGHAVVFTREHRIWSNDIRAAGSIDLTTVAAIEARWGYQYLGWTESINLGRIYGHVPSLSADAIRDAQRDNRAHRHGALVKRELAVLPFIPDHWLDLSNGRLGGGTDRAVAELQRRLGLKATGLVGPRVLGHLADHRHRFTARP